MTEKAAKLKRRIEQLEDKVYKLEQMLAQIVQLAKAFRNQATKPTTGDDK